MLALIRINFFLFTLFSPLLVWSQVQSSLEIENEVFLLDERFFNDPFIRLTEDTIAFEMNADSVIMAKSVQQKNSNVIWLIYLDKGWFDFWETHARNKHDRGLIEKADYETYPKKYIQDYFQDQELELLELVIYSSQVNQRLFLLCGSCYSGVDFIFKIKAKDYRKLCRKTNLELKILNNQ